MKNKTNKSVLILIIGWGILTFAIGVPMILFMQRILPAQYPTSLDYEGNPADYRSSIAFILSIPVIYFACYCFSAWYLKHSRAAQLLREVDDEFNIRYKLQESLKKKDDWKNSQLLQEIEEIIFQFYE